MVDNVSDLSFCLPAASSADGRQCTWSIILSTSCQLWSLDGQSDWGYGGDSLKPYLTQDSNQAVLIKFISKFVTVESS